MQSYKNNTNTTLYCTDIAEAHAPGNPWTYASQIDLRIIVLTYNRAISLQHTLESLNHLVLDHADAAVEIWIDCSKEGELDQDTYSTATAFQWQQGNTNVHVWRSHVGLYGQWIDTWRPWDNSSEGALFVEDDIDLAPYAWRWLRAAKEHYMWMADVSGYGLKDEELSRTARRVIRYDAVFMRRHHLPWGFSPVPKVWRQFQVSYVV